MVTSMNEDNFSDSLPQDSAYGVYHVRIGQSPEQFADFMIDWCADTYYRFGLVPRITFNDDGSVAMVEGIPAKSELLKTHTFGDAFVVLNGITPVECKKGLTPGHRYIHRQKGNVDGKWRPASQYHLPDKDYTTSLCGAAVAGKGGYEIVFSKTPVMRARTCTHCARGTTTRQKD